MTYPTDKTRPVSARPASSCTPRIRCSRIEDTSVGEALASAAYVRACFEAAVRAGVAIRTLPVAEMAPTAVRLDCRNAFLNIVEELQGRAVSKKESLQCN